METLLLLSLRPTVQGCPRFVTLRGCTANARMRSRKPSHALRTRIHACDVRMPGMWRADLLARETGRAAGSLRRVSNLGRNPLFYSVESSPPSSNHRLGLGSDRFWSGGDRGGGDVSPGPGCVCGRSGSRCSSSRWRRRIGRKRPASLRPPARRSFRRSRVPTRFGSSIPSVFKSFRRPVGGWRNGLIWRGGRL